MSRIHRIIYSEIVPPSVIAFTVLTFIVLAREFGRLAEMLIRKNADTGTVLQAVLFLLPSILIFTLPIGFLIGTLVGFSRLSSESEIVAMRACGISRRQILRPVLRTSLGVAFLTLLMTLIFLPEGNWNLRLLRWDLGLRPVHSAIKPRVFNEELPGLVLYVEDIEPRSGHWRGVFLAETSNGKKRIILSQRGHLVLSQDRRRLQLHLEKGSVYHTDHTTPEKDSLGRFSTLDLPIEFPEMEQVVTRPKKPQDKSVWELVSDLRERSHETSRLASIELQRRVALPLAVLVFALLGVSFGIRTHRGGRGYGFVLGTVVAFTHYVLFATGSELARREALPVLVGVWGANAVLLLLGLFSVRFAESASPHFSSRLPHPVWPGRLGRTIGQFFRSWIKRLLQRFAPRQPLGRKFSQFRLRTARVVDLYLIRLFLLYLLSTLAICFALFYLFTFFELIDDTFTNRTPYTLLLAYFFYLAPHVFTLLLPISVLITTLVTLGILEKSKQIVAFKSCGVSLYRIVAPLLALSIGLSACLFILQEYILPYANQRQDNFRHIIQGRPIQTFYQPGRSWIFGEGNRLYHYNYFDFKGYRFAEVSIYDLEINGSRFIRHIHAERATWDAETRNWELVQGWVRTFDPSQPGLETFTRRELYLPETPSYFHQEVKESNKMTYLELSDYIGDLQTGGFEVDYLKTELYKKVSFPIVSVIMTILGVPFALFIGNKGALYGIAIGVLTGIIYWGLFGVFGVLGANGFLSPLLAAWGPNILFGSGGLLLLTSAPT